MLACILFVFGALTEYAFLLFRRGMMDEEDHIPVLPMSAEMEAPAMDPQPRY